MISLLEELSTNALPARETILYDGWMLRFNRGMMRRANSVTPLYESSIDVDEKIDYCEQLYAQKRIDIAFKMTASAHPPTLADALMARDYHEDGRTSVQTCTLSRQPYGNPYKVDINPVANSSWLANEAEFTAPSNPSERHIATKDAFERLVPKAAFVTLSDRYQTTAVGLAVLERGWIGIYNVAVSPDMRQQGVGRLLMQTLINWGVDHGAKYGYLQVMLNNPAALHLYARMGFQEAYQYWYLKK